MGAKTAMQLISNVGGYYALSIQVKRVDGLITKGICIGDVTYQNQAILLMMQKGELKEYPTVGCGLSDIINDENLTDWKAEIMAQLEADGQQIKKLAIDNKGLMLEANYK